MKSKLHHHLLATLLCVAFTVEARAQNSSFTYQGQLTDNGSPASGIYDLRFTIYDSSGGPTVVAGPITNAPTAVSNGLFTATLNFGAGAFDGGARWLEIAARTSGGGAFSTLSPRQAITATPYAITASNLSGTLPATQLTGTLPNARLSGNVSMLGTNIDSSEIVDGTIVNVDISASAAIADSKLATISTAGKVANSALASSVSLLGQTIETGEITDSTITSADIADGTIVNADISGSAAIADSKLATISTAGKVADSALSSNIARLNGTNVFSGTNTFAGVVIATNANNIIGGSFTGTVAASQLTGTINDARLSGNVSLLGASVDSAEIADGSIVNADISGSAAIADTKLATISTAGKVADTALSGSVSLLGQTIESGEIADGTITSADIADGTIANADISGSAAIADSKLATISTAGKVSDSALSANIARLNGTNVFTGTNRFSGVVLATNANNVIAGTFSGNGSAVTNLSASQLTGTIADARLSTNVSLFGPNIDSSEITDGTIVNADISGSAAITDTKLATIATAGKVADSALSTNVSKLGPSIESSEITDGTITTNDLHASVLNGTFWKLGGNTGANPTNGIFLGTTDNQPLEFKVNNLRAMRLEYGNDGLFGESINVIVGYRSNFLAGGVVGAVVSGGGRPGSVNRVTDDFGTVGGGSGNTAASFATVGGGLENTASSFRSTVGGGSENFAGGDSYSTVSGGWRNIASNYAATIGGGEGNFASGDYATIPGGYNNVATNRAFAAGFRAKANHPGAFVWADNQSADFASTTNNQFLIRASGGVAIGTNDPAGAALRVAGSIKADSYLGMGATLMLGTTDNQPLEFNVNNERGLRLEYADDAGTTGVNVIGGYSGNVVSGAAGATIGGGGSVGNINQVTDSHGTVGGGRKNTAGFRATVAGGEENTASGFYSTVPGGTGNTAAGDFSFAAGTSAKANHEGAFVWADHSSFTDFTSTSSNQFNIRAAGGARLFTGGTGLKLDSDSVVFSGSAQTARFGNAAGFDFNTGVFGGASSGVLIEQGLNESSGIFFDGDSITLWSPGDDSGNGTRLFRILDEDFMGAGAAAAERFYVDGSGGIFSAGSATISSNATIAGKLGIGTTNPSHTLTVQNTSNEETMRLIGPDAVGSGARLNFGDGDFVYLDEYADDLLRIQATRVGIGRDAAANRLEVEGLASKSAAGDWLANSDRRIKQNIQPVAGALDTLNRVRLVSFHYTDKYRDEHPSVDDRRYLNVVAQEFAEVFPEHVKSSGEKMPDGSEILQVDTWPVTIYSAAAIQELNKKVDSENAELRRALKQKQTEVTELQQRLEKLEQLVAQKLSGGAM